ncbi:MAG: hypothetical protein M1820_003811 [Bogoriella megaspora]|nr:MAG: hypothetical protein M1820_003811 [Bogoriella megaspora]
MSDDASYASFLNKANQDTGASASTQSKSQPSYSTNSITADVPAALQKVDEIYISDSDEPFEPVSLQWEGKSLPSEKDLADLIGHKAEVSEVGTKDFDPRGQYKNVLDAVGKAGDGDVKVFRVEHGSTRAEYYVVSLDGKGGRVVGLKAKAVES